MCPLFLDVSVVCVLSLLLSACAPSYPEKTLTTQLRKLILEEENISANVKIAGKTLWVYAPLENLISTEEKTAWDPQGLEKMNKVLSIAHRVVLSTDAPLDFLRVVAADVKKYGVELISTEYIPDVREAILEKFSRGEFFMRSIKDVGFSPETLNDLTGESKKFYDITFTQFLCSQIIHRAKSLFNQDRALNELFEFKSSSWNEISGRIKINFEFLQKKYGLSSEEEKIAPLDYVKMITALVVKNYDFKNFQTIELQDTFSGISAKLTPEDLKKIKINLPEFNDL